MSVESITWALKVPVPASSAKFVLVVLANQANDETGLAFPSIAYLADATGQDRKTVIGNIGKLIEWGLIEDTGQRVGATKQVIVYRLLKSADLFAEQSQKRNSPKSGTVPKTDGNSTVFPPKQSQKRDTEPSLNHQEPKEQKQGRGADAPDLPAWLDADAWAMWHRYRNGQKGWNADARKLSLRKLDKLRGEGHDPRAVIEQSIERGWTGLFPVHEDRARAGPHGNGTESKTLTGMKSLQDLKHGTLVQQRNHRRSDEAHVLELGSDACRRLGNDHGGDLD